MFELRNVTKKFGTEFALRNVSAEIGGGLNFITGASGSGKTTQLKIISGLEPSYEGAVFFEGRDLKALTARERSTLYNSVFGFVWQDFNLLEDRTVLENVLLPRYLKEDLGEKRALNCLRELRIDDLADQKAGKLSGGQKQRSASARALMGAPRLILADEPTSALDRATSNEIMALWRELSADRLVVVITHDAKVRGFADEVLHIENKRIAAERTSADRGEAPVVLPAAAKAPDVRKRVGRNFRLHLGRYLAAALAISIGLLDFLFSLSFGNVMDREVLAFQEKNTAFNNGYIKGADSGTILELLQSDGRIEEAYYQYTLHDVTIALDGQTETLDEKLPLPKATESLSYGVMPRRGGNEIALSPSLAKKFASGIQNLLGQTVTLTADGKSYDLTVSGIYNAGYDDFFVSSDVEQALYEGLSGQDNYAISYDVASFGDVVAVSNSLKLRGVVTKDAAGEVYALQQSFRQLEWLFTGISVLVLSLALFLCAVLLFKLQNARYRELGLLSALGFRAGDLRTMIRWENLLLSIFSAAVSGVLLALAAVVCLLVDFPLALGVSQVLLCVGGAFVVILAVSALASVRLLRTEPAEALRRVA